MPITDNTLSATEAAQGFTLLFNGHSLKGWRTYRHKPGSWMVDDSAINCRKMENGLYADLITEAVYENFELRMHWKIEPLANSGIMYMVTEEYEEAWMSGPEYQILDDEAHKGKIESWQKTAAAYAIQGPGEDALKPVGEWNHTVIIVNNGCVEHWLNDKRVVSYDIGSEAWQHAVDNGKWKNTAGYAKTHCGHIALQDYHGNGQVWYKNIKLRAL